MSVAALTPMTKADSCHTYCAPQALGAVRQRQAASVHTAQALKPLAAAAAAAAVSTASLQMRHNSSSPTYLQQGRQLLCC